MHQMSGSVDSAFRLLDLADEGRFLLMSHVWRLDKRDESRERRGPAYDPEGQAPDRPVLREHGGGGGGTAWDREYWLWPLPPAGPFAFVCEWPARGIAESRAEIDAAAILEAAGRALILWSDK
jgi:hypothetical protein